MFDPIKTKHELDGDVGYEWSLARDFDKSRSLGGLSSSANAYLNMAVKCLLVGYDRPAQQLLKKAFNWLTTAIRDEERPRAYAAKGTEARRHLDLALCNWLLHERQDRESFCLYVENYEEFLSASGLAQNKAEISFALPHYVDAGAYRQALARYANAGMSPPESLASIRTEGQMSFVFCHYRLGEKYSAMDVELATEKFLKRNVNAWLIDGHFLRAAEWMKIIHWQEGIGVTAPQVLLKCYDYLSGTAAVPSKNRG